MPGRLTAVENRLDLRIVHTAAAANFGLGLAALGRPAYITLGHDADVGDHPDAAALETKAHAVLDAAWRHGIRYFDAARSYGLAEAFLGRWLAARSIDPAAVVIGSKWGYRYTADWSPDATVHEVKDLTRPTFDRQRGETDATLGSHLDLYQIHSATIESGVLDDPEVLAGLTDLAATGVAIGLSTTGPAQSATIRRALSVRTADGQRLFDAVQATWNLLEPSAGAALQEAADAGLVVIVKEALANGRLTNREPAIAARLAELASDAPADAVALAAALQQPWSGIVLSGAAAIDHLESNLTALDIDIDLTGNETTFAENPNEYWNYRSQLAWT
jgi:aryl-alcohol dehydrogenase-like predicted oxidoreductase